MAVQVKGAVSGVGADVDTNTRALKIREHPMDVLGSYQIEAISGSMAAGLAAASPIFSCRWGDATKLMLLRRVALDARILGTAFAAGPTLFDFIMARSFTVADSAGTSILPVTNSQKRRTSFGTTLISDLRISSTATLTAGTRTLDGSAMMNLRGHVTATAVAAPLVSAGQGAGTAAIVGANVSTYTAIPMDLISPNFGGEWPIILAQNEGFIIRATVPATGVWDFSVTMEWSEVTAY
jgi:hypothetical protein